MFRQFSECFSWAYIISGEREMNVFHFSGIFSAFNFWFGDGNIRYRNQKYQYFRGWKAQCIVAQNGKPSEFQQTIKKN